MKIVIETKNNLQNKKQESRVKDLIRELVVGLNFMGLKVITHTIPQFVEKK